MIYMIIQIVFVALVTFALLFLLPFLLWRWIRTLKQSRINLEPAINAIEDNHKDNHKDHP